MADSDQTPRQDDAKAQGRTTGKHKPGRKVPQKGQLRARIGGMGPVFRQIHQPAGRLGIPAGALSNFRTAGRENRREPWSRVSLHRRAQHRSPPRRPRGGIPRGTAGQPRQSDGRTGTPCRLPGRIRAGHLQLRTRRANASSTCCRFVKGISIGTRALYSRYSGWNVSRSRSSSWMATRM